MIGMLRVGRLQIILTERQRRALKRIWAKHLKAISLGAWPAAKGPAIPIRTGTLR